MHKVLIAVLVTWSSNTYACDLCSIYNSIQSKKPAENTWQFGVAEQFTSYSRIQQDGRKVENVAHQHLESSITQLYGEYDISDRVGALISLPYINRRYRRVEGEGVARGTEAGIGDLSLLAKVAVVQFEENNSSFFLQLLGGVKLPTGDSDRLKEELEEIHHDGEADAALHPIHGGHHDGGDEVESAIHGHDLALGTGGVDIPVGISIFARDEALFLTAEAQYIFRRWGDYSYRYANDLQWSAGPGVYLISEHTHALAFKVNLSGEFKRKDFGKEKVRADDTALNVVALGPEILLTTQSGLTVDFGLDLPLSIQSSAYQAVESYRVRGAVSYRF